MPRRRRGVEETEETTTTPVSETEDTLVGYEETNLSDESKEGIKGEIEKAEEKQLQDDIVKPDDEADETSVFTKLEAEIHDEVESEMFDEKEPETFAEVDEKTRKETIKKEKEQIENKLSKAGVKTVEEELIDNGLKLAGKKTRRQMYSDDKVIPLEDEIQYESEGMLRKKAFLELVESQKSSKILKGKVTGSKVIGGKLVACVKHDKFFKVYIPYELFINPRPADAEYIKNNPEQAERHKRLLINQRAFSEVDFIVRGVDEEEGVATGDRISAMKRLTSEWYLGKTFRDNYILNEGQELEARIVYTTPSNMIVELYGKEYILSQNEISYKHIANVSDEYQTGSTIKVVITKLERKKVGKQWSLKAKVSVKQALSDPRKENFYKYDIGENVTAVVTGIDIYGIYCRIEDEEGESDILIKFSTSNFKDDVPKVGSLIYLTISEKNEQEYRIFGHYIKTLRKPKNK